MSRHFNYIILLFLLCSLFTACEDLHEVSIDNLMPGKFNFISGMDSVVIVNNTIQDATIDSIQNFPHQKSTWTQNEHMQGDPKITIGAIAQAIADQNYFKQVMICDSALRKHDSIPYNICTMRPLNQDEVTALCNDLHSNVIISLEDILIKVNKKAELTHDNNHMFWQGTTLANVYPIIRIYIPSRSREIATFSLDDSIAWEYDGDTFRSMEESIPPRDTIKNVASDYAGYICKSLVPNWVSEPRYYYASDWSSNDKYITYLITNGKWDEVQKNWEGSYKSFKGKQKVEMALNIALANEMNNDIDNAKKWVMKAKTLASKNNKYKLLENQADEYKKILEIRATEYMRLNLQMNAQDNKM